MDQNSTEKSSSLISALAKITGYIGLLISDVCSFAIGNLFCHLLDEIVLEAALLMNVKRKGKENNSSNTTTAIIKIGKDSS